ncbi:hypothetical protein Tco_0966469 [Tanacetum coccineum]
MKISMKNDVMVKKLLVRILQNVMKMLDMAWISCRISSLVKADGLLLDNSWGNVVKWDCIPEQLLNLYVMPVMEM